MAHPRGGAARASRPGPTPTSGAVPAIRARRSSGWRDQLGPGARADGASTSAPAPGKLTRELVGERGRRWWRSSRCRRCARVLERACPAARALDGTAEALPVDDGRSTRSPSRRRFTGSTCPATLAEFHRVLRPAAGSRLIWNRRRREQPLHRAINEITEPYRARHPEPSSRRVARSRSTPAGLFARGRRARGATTSSRSTPTAWSTASRSISFIAALPGAASATRCSPGSGHWRPGPAAAPPRLHDRGVRVRTSLSRRGRRLRPLPGQERHPEPRIPGAWPPPTASPTTRRITELTFDFLGHLELERGLSRNTLEAYRSDLQQFAEFLERRELDPLAVQTSRPDRVHLRAGHRRRPSGRPRRRPRSSARSPACARSTATCAASRSSTTTPRPSCARPARGRACPRC